MAASTPSGARAQQRLLGLSLTSGPVLVLVALSFVLPLDPDDAPPVPLVVGLLAVALGAVALAETVGFRVAPLAPGDSADAAQVSLERFRIAAFLRFAITELPVVVGIIASFVLDHGLWPYLVVAVVAIPAMAWEVLPTRRTIDKTVRALESEGVPSRLDEALA